MLSYYRKYCSGLAFLRRERDRRWSIRRWLGGASWSEVSRGHSLSRRTEKQKTTNWLRQCIIYHGEQRVFFANFFYQWKKSILSTYINDLPIVIFKILFFLFSSKITPVYIWSIIELLNDPLVYLYHSNNAVESRDKSQYLSEKKRFHIFHCDKILLECE